MADHQVIAALLVRSGLAANWTSRNPTLRLGEYGIESDTLLLKVGDGVRDWNHLPYLNKIDPKYFKHDTDGTITFSDEFDDLIETLKAAAGEAISHLTITDPPVNDTDAANKKYVDDAIAAAGHLHREIVSQLPAANEADPDVLYMVPASSGNYYEEYMIINGVWDMVGETGEGSGYELQIATESRLGGVKSSSDPDHIAVNPNTGFMTLTTVSTSLLYVPNGDTLIINGGSA